jgi:hypothetical protein
MWHTKAILIAMAGMLFFLVPQMHADSLQLKNGNFVQGKYLGGTERAVQFEANGKIRIYDINEILSISFAAASADGGMPSGNVDQKPNADVRSDSSNIERGRSRTAQLNDMPSASARVQQIAWKQKQYSSGSNLPLTQRDGRSAAGNVAVKPNSKANARIVRVNRQRVRISPQGSSILSD